MTKSKFKSIARCILVVQGVCLMLSCSYPKTEEQKIYHIIGQEDTPANKKVVDPYEPPPPPVPFYGHINLILQENSTVYFHTVNQFDHSDTEIEVPLTKTDLVKVDLRDLPGFLRKTYERLDSTNAREYFTCVKSANDTITSEAFPIIRKFFDSKKFRHYGVRNSTKQEQRLIQVACNR